MYRSDYELPTSEVDEQILPSSCLSGSDLNDSADKSCWNYMKNHFIKNAVNAANRGGFSCLKHVYRSGFKQDERFGRLIVSSQRSPCAEAGIGVIA